MRYEEKACFCYSVQYCTSGYPHDCFYDTAHIRAFKLSFTDSTGMGQNYSFVGLENYAYYLKIPFCPVPWKYGETAACNSSCDGCSGSVICLYP